MMMEEVQMLEEFLKSISIVFYEALCYRIFLDIFLRQRFMNTWSNSLFVILLAGFIWGLGCVTQFQDMYVYRTLGIVVGIFLLGTVFYLGKWYKKIFLCGAFYTLLYCVDYFSFVMLSTVVDHRYLENSVIQTILVLLCKTILFVVVLGIRNVWNRGREVQMKGPAWVLMISFPVLSMIIMLVMLFSFLGKKSTAGYLTVSFVIMVMNVIMFEWLQFVSERDRRWNQIRLLQERNEERMQIYHEMSVNYEEQKRMLHDYCNQIGCVQGLLKKRQYKEAEAYAEKLSVLIPGYIQGVDVNHPILNVVLNQKYRLARSRNISVLFYVNDLSDLWLEEQDAVSLLANLLDNAIEACEKQEDERKIWIKLVMEKRQFVLSIRNTVFEPVIIENNEIPTSKEDQGKHGFGLRNVRMILDKYEGMGMMNYEEGCFSYTAVMPEINN